MTYYISLKKTWKLLFNANVIENFDWIYYHQKPETNPETNPETWYVNEKIFVTVEC